MKIYYRVTRDKYELICGIGDTPKELAYVCGVKHKTVLMGLERYKKGIRSQWRVVEL